MMAKNVMIPLTLLDQLIELLGYWDVSQYDYYLRCYYHDVLDELVWKKQKLELRDAYAKIVGANSQEARDLARIRYLQQKRLMELDDEPPF